MAHAARLIRQPLDIDFHIIDISHIMRFHAITPLDIAIDTPFSPDITLIDTFRHRYCAIIDFTLILPPYAMPAAILRHIAICRHADIGFRHLII
jgi:hypothetical protein